MKQSTGRDIQRVTFVDNLYKELRLETVSAIEERDRLAAFAENCVTDGLSDSESVEYMMIETGIPRVEATSYIDMAKAENEELEEEGNEYSFQFADVSGKVWSSNDISKRIFASNHEEAWDKTEEFLFGTSDMEPEQIISVDRVA